MPINSAVQRSKAIRPRLRIPGRVVPHKRDRAQAPAAEQTSGGYDEAALMSSKQKKEQYLAERAKIASEREAIELAARKGELVSLQDAQTQLEREHSIWISMIDDWRQAINKRLSKLGIPVEVQESISEMIVKETTIMRQKRAVAE